VVRRAPTFRLESSPSAVNHCGLVWHSAHADLNEAHDIVIDQRGTVKSASSQCTEIAGMSFEDLVFDLDFRAEIVENIARVQARLARFEQNDPQHYNRVPSLS